jgi:hypothetical protein
MPFDKELQMKHLDAYKAILGALKGRESSSDSNMVHSSDFRRAIGNLGFDFGHSLMDDVIVRCGIDPEGFVDIGPLTREVDALDEKAWYEKLYGNDGRKGKVFRRSKALAEHMKRTDIHKRQIAAEHQAKMVRSKLTELMALYHVKCGVRPSIGFIILVLAYFITNFLMIEWICS